jgi:hypothetical protein
MPMHETASDTATTRQPLNLSLSDSTLTPLLRIEIFEFIVFSSLAGLSLFFVDNFQNLPFQSRKRVFEPHPSLHLLKK